MPDPCDHAPPSELRARLHAMIDLLPEHVLADLLGLLAPWVRPPGDPAPPAERR